MPKYAKKITVGIIGVISLLYLFNPGFGLFEFIPDGIPFIGNLDEATATFLLLSSLSYFGINVKDIFENKKNNRTLEDVANIK